MTPLFLLLLSLTCGLSLAFGSGNFISPPNDYGGDPSTYPVYKVGDVLSISWTCNSSSVGLIINQNMSSLTEFDYLPNPDSANLTTNVYSWTIAIDGSNGNPKFDLLFNNNFNFELFEIEDGSLKFFATSTYFNITNSTVDQYGKLIPSSTSSTSISLSTSSSTSTSTPTAALPTTSSIKQPSPSTETTGLSFSAKIGLGVGLGVTSVAIIGGFALQYILRRNRRQIGSDPTREAQKDYAINDFGPDNCAQNKDAHLNLLPASELDGELAQAHQFELDGTTAPIHQSKLDRVVVEESHLIELP